MSRASAGTLLAVALLASVLVAPADSAESGRVSVEVTSTLGYFAAVVTRPDPLPVERLHTWQVRLFDRKRHAVVGARIQVTGDMPAHGHGLPTSPVAVGRGSGLYVLQGMMFQMPGRWYVQLRIRTASRLDRIRVGFTIEE